MTIVLPKIWDRWRTLRNGKKKWVGQVLLLQGGKFTVIAEVYGSSVKEMRARKMAAWAAIKQLEETSVS